MRITNDALDAVRWDGQNTAEVEDLAGVRCVDATTVLVVPATDADPREGLLGGEPLHLPRGGWLLRADGSLRVLPAEAGDALVRIDGRDGPASTQDAPEGTAA